jgi:serine/threonine protein kinase
MSRVTSAHRNWRMSEGGAEKVGKYRVLCELGRGGMANVFLAVARGPSGVSKLVVLKALLPQLASDDGALAMFLDEARLAAQLNHGNVVQTYEIGQEGERHVIVMEYLEGQSLARITRHAAAAAGELPLSLHLRVIVQVLEGLHYAHELRAYDGQAQALVHRDVSPQNVFVTYDGRVKLLDFGIAKAASSTTETAAGLVKGKIAYMAPEQMAGTRVDRRADVYAVGCMLWAAAAGRKLWKDVPDAHIVRDKLVGAIPSPKQVNPSCDDELDRIVSKAIATDPAARYGSARELQAELERYCDQANMLDRPRDLGQFVSTLFAAQREELKTRIEQELSLLTADLSSPGVASESRSMPRVIGELPAFTDATRTLSGSTITGAGAAPGRRRRVGWIVAALVGLVGIGFQFAKSEAPTVSKAAPLADALVTAKIELRATPGNARLFLDGQPLVGNPTLRVMPVDGKLHQLRADLNGHQTAAAEFKVERDATVELRLTPLVVAPPAAKAAQRPSEAPVRKKAETSKPRRKTANCNQPFFVDTDGIKKVRPGCL